MFKLMSTKLHVNEGKGVTHLTQREVYVLKYTNYGRLMREFRFNARLDLFKKMVKKEVVIVIRVIC